MIKVIGNTNPSSNGMNGNVFDESGISPTLSTNKGEGIKVGTWRTHKDGQGFRETSNNNCPTIPARAREDGSGQPVIMIKSNTKKGFDTATENDSINFSVPTSETRRGRVGIGVAQTLDTQCNQAVCIPVLTPDRINKRQNGRRFKQNGDASFTLTTQDRHGIYDGYRIRRLTPRECARLQDFPESHIFNVSDSQHYKQFGNSITVRVLEKILLGLKKL